MISRRELLIAGAGIGLAARLGGCGGDPQATPTDTAALADTAAPTIPDGDTSEAPTDAAATTIPDGDAVDAEVPPERFDADALAPSPTGFPLGVQSGDPRPDGALLWAAAPGAAALTLHVFVPEAAAANAGPLVARHDVAPVDGYAHVALSGLAPATEHRFAFVDAAGLRSPIGRFRTAPAPDALPVVVFGGSSCAKLDFAPFDVLTRASEQALDLFLLAGDTTYADDATTLSQYRDAWSATLGRPEYRALLASTSVVATWDDHEVDNNWDPETMAPARVAAARRAFFEHLAVPRAPDAPDRIWRSLRVGRTLELFVLDTRSHRRPSASDTDPDAYLGEAQMRWLTAALPASDAVFKVILNSVPVGDYPPVFLSKGNRWEGYPAARAAVLDACRGVPGLVWVSGDFHFGAVTRVDPPGGPHHGLHEVLMGPVAHVNPLLAQLELTGDPAQFPFTTGSRNYVRFVADPSTSPPALDVAFVDPDGAVLHAETLVLG